MKSLPLVAVCALAAAAATGCSRTRDAQARTTLDCPTAAGKLNRTSVAADGRTCTYVDAKGDELTLRLIPVATTPDAALAPIEQQLQAQAGPAAATPASAPSQAAGAPGKTASAAANAAIGQAKADADAAEDANDDGAEAAMGHKKGHDHADISLPGLHVVADDDKAEVKVGGVHVNASSEGAVVRTARDVKMRGNPFVLERKGYRASYMLARDNMPGGFVLIGYEAGGPRTGPLTVAVIKAKGHENGVFARGKKLVRLNGGI